MHMRTVSVSNKKLQDFIYFYDPSYELIFSEDYLREAHFDLDQYCYFFDHTYQNSIRLQYLSDRINAIVDTWKAEQHAREVFLYYVWKGDRLEVHDGRSQPEKVTLLDKHETDILNIAVIRFQ